MCWGSFKVLLFICIVWWFSLFIMLLVGLKLLELFIICKVKGWVIVMKLKFGFNFFFIFFRVEKVCIIKVKVVGKWKGWL